MPSYYLKRKKNAQNINPRILKTSTGKCYYQNVQ